ncbi:MAG: S41 family peptidase [Paludibacteraceae bacterium]
MKKIISLLVVLLAVLDGYPQFGSPQLQKLSYATYAISRMYVDTVKESKLVDDAIEGMLEKLDPHSVYIPVDEVKRMNEPLEGSFDGIGVQFQMMEDTLLVIQTISGGPSEKVGIMAGDRIVYVDDTTIAGVKMQNTDVMKRLRGPKGTVVNVKILRRGVKNLIDFRIVRDKIPIYSLDASYMVTPEIGYIKINRFSATTTDEYHAAFSKLKDAGMKSLILDLQGNGGGYLTAAIDLADEFVGGDKLLLYTEGAAQPRQTLLSSKKGGFEDGNLVVLVDEGSASASEIVSGALQDWDRALLVGRRTFGKGLVQKPIVLPDESQIRLTIARYYTPTGRCIQRPYKDGIKQYNRDMIDRYNHGELMHADSIVFPDSLKYKTLMMRRTVYGGGGIMPDIFVPLDTLKYTDYHRNLVAKGVVNKFVLNYVEKNRDRIMKLYPKKKAKSFEKFNKEFVVGDGVLAELVEAGNRDSVKFNEDEFEKSAALLKLQLKALVARDIWDMNEYYQVMNENNESYRKAVELLEDENLFKNSFSGKK